jgi:hypothetical protein
MKTKPKTARARQPEKSNGSAITKPRRRRVAAAPKLRTKRPSQKLETPYDRIKHLLGSLHDLPADLTTNPKYMEGFGE